MLTEIERDVWLQKLHQAEDKDVVYMLRTSAADGTSQHSPNFKWPESGYVECVEWNGKPICGYGLFGLRDGAGRADTLTHRNNGDARWIVWKTLATDVVNVTDDDGGKSKAQSGFVVYCGHKDGAVKMLQALRPLSPVVYGTATAGNRGTATAGYAGTATAGYAGTATAGYGGTATAGNRGTATAGHGGTATAGNRGTATAGHGGTATAGNRGTATAGYAGTATAGNRGTATAGDAGTATAGDAGTATAGDAGTATAGDAGTATAGNLGILNLRWYDGDRYRVAVFYVGEDGIEANVAYKCKKGKAVKVAK